MRLNTKLSSTNRIIYRTERRNNYGVWQRQSSRKLKNSLVSTFPRCCIFISIFKRAWNDYLEIHVSPHSQLVTSVAYMLRPQWIIAGVLFSAVTIDRSNEGQLLYSSHTNLGLKLVFHISCTIYIYSLVYFSKGQDLYLTSSQPRGDYLRMPIV
jgi:hypothetical protein